MNITNTSKKAIQAIPLDKIMKRPQVRSLQNKGFDAHSSSEAYTAKSTTKLISFF